MNADTNDTVRTGLISFAVVAVVSVIAGGVLYGCQGANTKYYALANQCINQGGSWIPSGGDGYSGICVSPRGK